MSEMDEEVVDGVDDTAYTEDVADQPDEVSWEQAMEWKKKAERLEKAEKKLVELKKATKAVKPASEGTSAQFLTKQDLEVEKFMDRNPELADYKDELKAYIDKGLSIQNAKLLLENDEKVLENKRKANSMNLSTTEGGATRTTYTKQELADMDQFTYNQVRDAMAAGKARVV